MSAPSEVAVLLLTVTPMIILNANALKSRETYEAATYDLIRSNSLCVHKYTVVSLTLAKYLKKHHISPIF